MRTSLKNIIKLKGIKGNYSIVATELSRGHEELLAKFKDFDVARWYFNLLLSFYSTDGSRIIECRKNFGHPYAVIETDIPKFEQIVG